MRRSMAFCLAAGLGGLAACTSGAPPAPFGLDRHPANTPETLAELSATGERTPETPPATVSRGPGPATAPAVHRTVGAPYTISDFNTPGGLSALSASDRLKLVKDAKAAASVIILVRGDAQRPNRATWHRLALRGGEAKRFLVRQGVLSAKIRIFVRSAGAFVADNATGEGRARNRRIEIHMNEVNHGQSS